MGIPILTSEGFVGQRWIIDDYFQAGETLHAGDCVAFLQAPGESASRVWKIYPHILSGPPDPDGVYPTWTPDMRRAIGVVHTPAGKQVGGEVAQANDYVCIVTKGIAKAFSSEAIGVGDPVIPSGDAGTGPGGNSVARVAESTGHADSKTGPGDSHSHSSGNVGSGGNHSHSSPGTTGSESAHEHGESGDHEHELGTANAATEGHNPSYGRSISLRRSGNPGYGWTNVYVGDNHAAIQQGLKTGGQMSGHSHGSAGSHNHTMGGVGGVGNHSHSGAGSTGSESGHKHTIDRAIVVGKCLTPATGANQVIDILVDIAG